MQAFPKYLAVLLAGIAAMSFAARTNAGTPAGFGLSAGWRRTTQSRANPLTLWHLSPDQGYPTTHPLVFVGDPDGMRVQIYPKNLTNNPAPIATITDMAACPLALAMDKPGTLYVAENCGINTVVEYPKGQTTHSTVISTGISDPLGLAVDRKGTLYVSNYPAAITEYKSGATSPFRTVTGGGLTNPCGLAVDRKQNLYIADFGASQVFELAHDRTTVTPLNLKDLTEPLGVAVDPAGNLWVTDGQGDKVNVYGPGSTTPLVTFNYGYSFPYAISIDAKGDAVISNRRASNSSEVYAYQPHQYTPYATLTNSIGLPDAVLIAKP